MPVRMSAQARPLRAIVVAGVVGCFIAPTILISSAEASISETSDPTEAEQVSISEFEEMVQDAAASGDAVDDRNLEVWSALDMTEKAELTRVATDPDLHVAVAAGEIDDDSVREISDDLRVDGSWDIEDLGPAEVVDSDTGKVTKARDKRGWGRRYVHAFGYVITEVRLDMYYKASGGNVLRVMRCTPTHKNRSFMRHMSLQDNAKWITSSRNGVCQATWHLSYGIHVGPVDIDVSSKTLVHTLCLDQFTVFTNETR